MKNFLYNKSDIFVALVIVVAAVLLIYTRVDAIMGGAAGQELNGTEIKPLPTEQTDPAETGVDPNAADPNATDPNAVDPNATIDPNAADPNAVDPATAPPDAAAGTDAPEDPTEPPDEATPTEPADTEPVLFTVEPGADSYTIAKNLAAAGLVKSSDAFLKEVARQNVEKKMQAGTFKIKPGTSVSKIVKTLTK